MPYGNTLRNDKTTWRNSAESFSVVTLNAKGINRDFRDKLTDFRGE